MKKHQSEINDRFVSYFRENFFENRPEELAKFLESLTKPLPKTIRVNTNRIGVEDFKARAERNNWVLTPTNNPTVFRIDRTDTAMPLGHTLEHLLGYFYIQELSASMSVHYLNNSTDSLEIEKNDEIRMRSAYRSEPYNNGTENEEMQGLNSKVEVISDFLILDMAASPGGKTTQLAEHFPHSIIVANEPTRDRMAQLVQNTERLGNDRIMIANYDGGFYGDLPETFDRVLLDAPCSWEGIGFKESQTVKYWNLKNIRTIARLQTKLLDAAFRTLKTGGEMLYSTCTLNKIENEGVVRAIRDRYPASFEVLFEKRFWPHEEASGGFFVCKIRKNEPLISPLSGGQNNATLLKRGDEGGFKKIRPIKTNEEVIPLTKDHERILSRFTETVGLDLSEHALYEFKKDILAIRKNSAAKALLQNLFTVRLGKKIGRIEEGVFTPDNRLGRDFRLTKTPVYEIQSSKELDDYLRGKEIEIPPSLSRGMVGDEVEKEEIWDKSKAKEWYYVLQYDGLDIGLESVHPKSGRLTNTFPREWQRK